MVKLRILFVLTVLVFGVQFFATRTGREPYPALILPGFGGQPLIGTTVRYYDPLVEVRFADGRTTTVPWRQVIPPAPVSMEWLFIAAYQDAGSDPSTAAWLEERIARLFPGESLASAHVTLRKARYNIDDESVWHAPNPSSLDLDLSTVLP